MQKETSKIPTSNPQLIKEFTYNSKTKKIW